MPEEFPSERGDIQVPVAPLGSDGENRDEGGGIATDPAGDDVNDIEPSDSQDPVPGALGGSPSAPPSIEGATPPEADASDAPDAGSESGDGGS